MSIPKPQIPKSKPVRQGLPPFDGGYAANTSTGGYAPSRCMAPVKDQATLRRLQEARAREADRGEALPLAAHLEALQWRHANPVLGMVPEADERSES
jgi:hypothetical protein